MNPFVILTRLILPLLILISPLLGGIVAVHLDGWDWHNSFLYDVPPIGDYQVIDKLLDLFYLFLFLIVTFRLKNRLVRSVLLLLFIDRFIGVILFEVTQVKWLLFVFPNIFENFFLFYYVIKTIARYDPQLSYRTVIFFLAVVGIPKLLDEYLMHVIEKPFISVNFGLVSFTYHWPEYGIIFLLFFAVFCGLYYRKKK